MTEVDRHTERRLFLALLLLNTMLFCFLILDRRMPRGHDTWQYYTTQYYFMSNASQGGGVALWLPSMTQGTASNWHQAWQGGIVHHVLLMLAPLLKGTNFLPLFYLSLYISELILLVGVWLLARRLYASPYTVFFVSAAAVGSCVWADQIWHNFHSYYAIPLIMAWGFDFLDTASRWKLFLAADLFLLQFFGNMPYTPLLSGLVLLFFGATWIALFRRSGSLLPRLRPRCRDVLWVGLTAAILAVVYVSLRSGTDLNVIRSPSRTPEGVTSLDGFMIYGGYTNPFRYLEFLHGISPSLNYTLFCGFLTSAFAVMAFTRSPGRRTFHLALAFAFSLLFSCGFLELAAPAVYVAVPGAKYFRHVSLIAPFVKLFLILLAGVGFERTMVGFPADPRPLRMAGMLFAGEALGIAAIALQDRSFLHAVFAAIRVGMPENYSTPDMADASFLKRTMIVSAASLAATGLLLLLVRRTAGSRNGMMLVLAFHVLQLFGWKLDMLHHKTLRLTDAQVELQSLQPIPYRHRRSSDYASNPRYAAFEREILARPDGDYGTIYWTTDSYLFMDTPSSRYRTTDWMAPLDELMRAYAGQPVHDRRELPAFWDEWILTFPMRHPAASRVIGLSADKIQIFSEAYRAGTSEEIGRLLTSPEYRGDLLFLHGSPEQPIPPLSASDRLEAGYEVLGFDANHLRIRTRVSRPAWLLYCDVWHPDWTAQVDGRPVAVERGQIAYKAVRLDPGDHTVEFRFRSPVRLVCFAVTVVNCVFFLAVFATLLVPMIFGGSPGHAQRISIASP